MSHGGGPYDPEAEELLKRLKAKAVVLIVHGGDRGDGFEVQCTNPEVLKALSSVLRGCAAVIDLDLDAVARHLCGRGRLNG